MSSLRCVGVDPGPAPGVVCLDFTGGALADLQIVQCTANSVSWIVEELLAPVAADRTAPDKVVLGVERFVVAKASGRSAGPGSTTRDMVGQLQAIAARYDVPCYLTNASQHKGWATGVRLLAAHLTQPTVGMVHARDAARIALWTAVKHGHVPDPLSSTWRKP